MAERGQADPPFMERLVEHSPLHHNISPDITPGRGVFTASKCAIHPAGEKVSGSARTVMAGRRYVSQEKTTARIAGTFGTTSTAFM